MALSDPEKIQIQEIFGLPPLGDGYAVESISSRFGPFAEPYDFAALLTELTARFALVNANAALLARVQAVLAEWTNVATSEVKVVQDTGAAGTLVDDAAKRRNIRRTLSNLLGFWAPIDGFWGEIERSMNRDRNRMIR